MQNFVREGRCIDYTPTADVLGGDIVVFPGMIAIASTDIPAGETGACEINGVYELPKAAGAIGKGERVFIHEATTDNVTTHTATATAGPIYAGIAWESAADGDAVVEVKINFGAPVAAAGA